VYHLLLFLHILSAVVWVGGAVSVQLLALMAQRSPEPSEVPRMIRYFEPLGTKAFTPAAVVLLLSGIVLTVQAWSFAQAWIYLAIALWLLSAVAGSTYLGPRAKRAAELFVAEGPRSVAARALVRRVFLVSRVELASFVVIVALMVFKPGA
jgi:uncharacterized membrane protein